MNEQIDENGAEPISRTRKKKELKALQRTGERLVDLSEGQIKNLNLPARLFDAVLDAKGMISHGARRRQMKFIGAIIRDIDPEPIRTGLDLIDRDLAVKNAAFHYMERLRDRLISGDKDVFREIHAEYPHTDLQRLRQLVRNAVKEKMAEEGGIKHYRALFKYLKELYMSGCSLQNPEILDREHR